MLKYNSNDEFNSKKNKKQSFTLCIVLSLIGTLVVLFYPKIVDTFCNFANCKDDNDFYFGIKPVLFQDYIIEIKFNKFKIAESINSFNENITINFSINAYDLIKESNYDNNSVGITFYVEK